MNTEKLFLALAENGKQHFTDKQGENWQSAGLALAEISGSAKDIAKLAYAFLEDGNCHAVASLLNWVFNLYENKYSNELTAIKYLLQSKKYVVNVKRNDDTGEWEKKTYKMVVSFEEVD